MADKTVCIGGNKYMIVDDGTGTPTATTVDMSITEEKLTRLVDIAGGGAFPGLYRSIKQDIPAREKMWEIGLGIRATQLNIRCDQAVTMNFNSVQGDNIFVESTEFPLSISDLNISEAITSVFISTGDNPTTVKILAFGMVGK
jgi:hypothetical protein